MLQGAEAVRTARSAPAAGGGRSSGDTERATDAVERTGMRRAWIVVATVVACAGLAGQTSIAYAESGNTRATSVCSDLIRNYKTLSKAQANANPGKLGSLSKVYSTGGRILNKLASSGPSVLRTAFKHIAQAYAKLAHVDFSKPSSISQLEGLVQQVGPDLQKVAAYFAAQCHYTIATT
jgi:hypothetical protein